MIMDFLRLCRSILYTAGQVQVFGIQVDFLLHFLTAFVLVLVLRKWLSAKKTSLLLLGLIAAKELIDIFAKSKIEYIRPPSIDLLYDVTAGVAGLCFGLALHARFATKKLEE